MPDFVIVIAFGSETKWEASDLHKELELSDPTVVLHLEGGYIKGRAKELVTLAKKREPKRAADIWVGIQGSQVWISTAKMEAQRVIRANKGPGARQVTGMILRQIRLVREG